MGTTFREIRRVDITSRIFKQAQQFYPDYRLFDMYESLRYSDCMESLPLLRNAVRVSPGDLTLRVGYASILGICNLPIESRPVPKRQTRSGQRGSVLRNRHGRG